MFSLARARPNTLRPVLNDRGHLVLAIFTTEQYYLLFAAERASWCYEVVEGFVAILLGRVCGGGT